MFVHFASLVDGNQTVYQEIVTIIKELGHAIVTDHYLTRTVPQIENESLEESQEFHNKFISWMKKADVIVYDITKNDINAGYEISHAMSMNKPVILLFEKGKAKIPFVFKGIHSELVQIVEYEMKDLEYYIKESLELAIQLLPVRFNVMITARQNHFISQVAEKKLLSKSSVIRKLINEEMVKQGYISNTDLASTYEIE